MSSPIKGFLLPFGGLRLITRPGLRRFVLVPLLLNIAVFGGLAYLAGVYFEQFMDHWLPEQGWLEFLRWLLWILFAAAYAVAVFYSFTLIANLIASPFNGILAARVEQHLTGQAPTEAEMSLIKSVGPAITGEIGKILYFLSRALPLLLLFLVPGLNVLVSVAWLAFGFWFLAIEYADYPMGNHELRPREQRARLRKAKLESLAFGAGVTVLMLIPVVQFAAMPAAVAAATRLWVEDLADR